MLLELFPNLTNCGGPYLVHDASKVLLEQILRFMRAREGLLTI
jgi:hypothetical protein